LRIPKWGFDVASNAPRITAVDDPVRNMAETAGILGKAARTDVEPTTAACGGCQVLISYDVLGAAGVPAQRKTPLYTALVVPS